MLISPKYILTPKISRLLSLLEADREVITSFKIPAEIEVNLRRQSTLKSSLFSAKIEGNTLSLQDLSQTSSKDRQKIEILNISKALNQVYVGFFNTISQKDILRLHSAVLQGLDPDAGKFRREVSAIFNMTGVAIYLTPPPKQIEPNIKKLLEFMNNLNEPFVPIKAILSHYTFEKIHPFIDGNGRVGRLLLQIVLFKGGYGMKGLVSLEEYLDKNRTRYYEGFEILEKDVTEYVEFMLEMITDATEEAKGLVLMSQNASPQDFLLPRRAEILNIIKDHGLVGFDTIKRRFLNINERTLRYDLKKLQDGEFIRKRGMTKGVFYEANEKEEV